MDDSTILKVENLTKTFPGVRALNKVDFELKKGEIHALIGENGAGKSTLMHIIGGVLKPDSGKIMLEGKPVSFSSVHDAIKAGISMVFQELSLVSSLSVGENIFANRQPVGAMDRIQWGKLYRLTKEFLQRFKLDLNPKTLVKNLSMGQQQTLEILKALSSNPKIILLDEPTSSLTEEEIAHLFENIRALQKQGMSFMYITHKLSEVFQIADRVTVLRDGNYIGTRPVNEVSENNLISMMVGREIKSMYGTSKEMVDSEEYFRVEDFARKGRFRNISLSLRKGEILGIAGLVGAGRTEFARAIFGLDSKDSGRIYLDGRLLNIRRPKDAIREGIAYITEDRKNLGLFLTLTLRENCIAPILEKFSSRIGLLKGALVDQHVENQTREFSIVAPSKYQKVINLSGGNQQKVLLAMWIGIRPKVVIFDEPTRGVDVGARADIYAKLRELSSKGTGIIIISSDLPELLGMCDRILVMHQGEITGEVGRADFSEEIIMAYATGLANSIANNNHTA
jgi:ABC-type sugar transport system ATPase subunit